MGISRGSCSGAEHGIPSRRMEMRAPSQPKDSEPSQPTRATTNAHRIPIWFVGENEDTRRTNYGLRGIWGNQWS